LTKNQIHWAVKEEMAVCLEDVLARRSRGLFIDAYETEKIAPKVAEIMASFIEKDSNWVEHQLKIFKPVLKNYQL